MRIDTGKSAKRMGGVHPKHARKSEPASPSPVSKSTGKKAKKNFGFTVERLFGWPAKTTWKRGIWSWHETAKQRDQAMAAWTAKYSGWWLNHYRDPQPIGRTSLINGDSR